MTLSIGDKAPDFSMPSDGGGTVSLSDFKDRYLVLYFYPRDDTPGCTKEAIGFSESKGEFNALGAAILGVSKDTTAKHDKFIAKHDLKVGLGSDESGEIIERYGVWVEKMNYGKKYMGIERATYLIGPDGKILEIWRKVRVKDHVEKVLTALQSHAS
ncbi:MAG: thioredoxin-dependent thiol peroxidase [Hellea sp.]